MQPSRASLFAAVAAIALAATGAALAAKPLAPPHCNARATRTLPPVTHDERQTLVVESFGACADPLLLVWIDRPSGHVQEIHLARLSEYAQRASTPRAARAAVRNILARVERKRRADFETWDQLVAGAESPGGWRGTPLSKAEYKRITSSTARVLLIPTDATRAKLIAWDDTNEEWVDVVYYGD